MKSKLNYLKFLICAHCFLPVISVMNLRAQDYCITFTGSGKSTTVDSVMVENLNQGTKLTLKGIDTLHLVTGTTGIETISGNIPGKIKFYPNPAKDESMMQFDLPEPGVTMISMFDIAGREITETRDMLYRGRQTYLIQGVREGLYIIRVISGKYSYSGKLICSGSGNRDVNIVYETTEHREETIKLSENKTGSKGIPGRKDMPYNAGERLHYRAYAGNSITVTTDVPSIIGNNYTINSVFVDCSDADNNHYSAVLIGTQIWMAENLKTTKLTSGIPIPNITGNNEWKNTTTPSHCWYDNDPGNKNIYGAIYNWYTAALNNICPVGWHLPTDEDWTVLSAFYGGDFLAGSSLKETGTTYWSSPNNASNESGFSARPGGFRDLNGGFFSIGDYGQWWSSTEVLESNAYQRIIGFSNLNVTRTWNNKGTGMSVRCIKNPPNTIADYDGNFYTTDTIGTQIWMGENLKTTHFNDGTDIHLAAYNDDWTNLSSPGYCWYNGDDLTNKMTYGALYNWYTVNSRKLCPQGWRIPTHSDWIILSSHLEGIDVAGGKMKETGTEHWASPNAGASNLSGFTALPAGQRSSVNGLYRLINLTGSWWTETGNAEYEMDAWSTSTYYDDTRLEFNKTAHKNTGLSVRCLMGEPVFVTDQDGNSYATVVIGSQEWMRENLKTTRYNNGIPIPFVTGTEWKDLSSPGYCWYNNDEAVNKDTYGALYNWHTVNTGQLCPAGWHVPNEAEWTVLTSYLGGISIGGGKLKEAGISHWLFPNSGATNLSGFTALPGGFRSIIPSYSNRGEYGHWWSSSEIVTGLNTVSYRLMKYNTPGLTQDFYLKNGGMSVRCLKDHLTDYDGNHYATVKIGNQEWMAENLKTIHFNDGTEIPTVFTNDEWANQRSPAYCWYDVNETVNKGIYGALYNWYTVNTGKLCPAGWHVPDNDDWLELVDYLGGQDWVSGKLKEAGTLHWSDPNTGATNEKGFTALPGGARYVEMHEFGEFKDLNTTGYWWLSSESYKGPYGEFDTPIYGFYYSFEHDNNVLKHETKFKPWGMSVRCMRDQ